MSTQRIAFLGASRGLGAAVVALSEMQNVEGLVISRQPKSVNPKIKIFSCDFAQMQNLELLQQALRGFAPHKLWYFAGGGPYGPFAKKDWKDHHWAWQVSFVTPAKLLHEALRGNLGVDLQQVIMVGSAVAEDKWDIHAASYAAAKHALKGLVLSIVEEGCNLDVRLFSPSYMDTELLPSGASPRQRGADILDPSAVAQVFWDWAVSDDGDHHFLYEHKDI